MAIQKEIWAKDIADKLFPDGSFMLQAMSDDMWVDGRKVHRAIAGAAPTVVVNRNSYPAAAGQRTDTDGDYTIDEFTSTPTHIADIEEIEVNYLKRQSVLFNHIKEINRVIGNQLQVSWSPALATSIVRTTGTAVAAYVPSATGTRKKLTMEDLLLAKGKLDDQEVPSDGRNILLPAIMFNNFLNDYKEELIRADYGGGTTIKDGHVQKILGFNVYIRGSENILKYTNAATPVVKAIATSGAATDNAAALCWHSDFVARALGETKIYADEDNPAYYGSIFSAMVRAGGQKRYGSTVEKGVVAIVEAAGT